MIVAEHRSPEPARTKSERPLQLLRLSAKSDLALRELANALRGSPRLARGGIVGRSVLHGQYRPAEFPHRLALAAASSAQAQFELAAFAAGEKAQRTSTGHVDERRRKVAFVFSGNGQDLVGIGRRLFETQPTFRRTMGRCAELTRGWLKCDLLEAIYSESGQPALVEKPTGNPALANAALFALEYALAELWGMWGIRPAAVTGRGVGEFAAACVAGVFRLEDALRLALECGRPRESTSAADMAARLPEPEWAGVRCGQPVMTFVSGVTGAVVREAELTDPGYWQSQSRHRAETTSAVTQLAETGYRLFVEIGPGAFLASEPAPAVADQKVAWLRSLRRDRDDWEQMLESLAELYVSGVNVDWSGFDRDYARQRVDAPTYPFRRERCWIEVAESSRHAPHRLHDDEAARHPLLGRCTRSPVIKETIFECEVAASAVALLERPSRARHGRIPDDGLSRNGDCCRNRGVWCGGSPLGRCRDFRGAGAP